MRQMLTGTVMAASFTLNEDEPGRCPVCQQNWSADPRLECACTRSQPDDDEQMAKAYLQSALCRRAKFAADAAAAWDAARRAHEAIRRGRGSVVPIGQARRGRAAVPELRR